MARNVLVTGCTPGGIGHALVKEFRVQGLHVIATARRLEVIEELRAEGIDILQLDVTDMESIRTCRMEVELLTNGKLDILVNNAGKGYMTPATDVTLEGIRSLFETNIFSVMMMCKEFASLLIAAQGKIINIGSVAGIVPFPFGSVYGASKAALHSYGDALRVELQPFGVQVITVVTGGVKSNIANKSQGQGIHPDSLYHIISDEFDAKRRNISQRDKMPTAEYARYVVSQTLKDRPPPWLWAGASSFLVWLVNTFVPIGYLDGVMARRVGLDTLKKRLHTKQRDD